VSASTAAPSVALFAMGGTIAMSPTESGPVAPALSGDDLLAAVPGLGATGTTVTVHDFCRKPGASLGFADLYALAQRVDEELAAGAAGVVVTQGTDTIEETSYCLDLLLATSAPVIVTGAMRNPAMAGADGPANLLAAVRVAASPAARGLGCLVVMDDQVHAARFVRKCHTGSTAAFASPAHGPLGHVVEDRVHLPVLLRRPSPTLRPDPGRRVRVGLTTIGLGDDGATVEATGGQVDGLVVEAMGAGHVPEPLAPLLGALAERIPVVLSSRTGAGPVHDHTYGFAGSETDLLARGLISAGWLGALKARVLVHLLLAAGADHREIRDVVTAAGSADAGVGRGVGDGQAPR